MTVDEMLKEFLRHEEARSPFAQWTSAKNYKPGDFVPFNVKFHEPPPPVDWRRATAAGFLGAVSARGYTLQLIMRGETVTYGWKHPHGGRLTGQIHYPLPEETTTRGDIMLEICAKLAGWEPELMHWRRAFEEIGVRT